jgi:hypothetical protein
MDNKPKALTKKEIEEIAAIEDIQQMWGAANAAEMEEMLDTTVYAVKFDYHSGSPGYVGDYFILQGDAIGEPLELIRNKDGAIVLYE